MRAIRLEKPLANRNKLFVPYCPICRNLKAW